jgi:Protein of unknown function (DUF3309)
MTFGTIVLTLFVVAFIASLPTWPHARRWGYGPSSGLGLGAAIVGVLLLAGSL